MVKYFLIVIETQKHCVCVCEEAYETSATSPQANANTGLCVIKERFLK